MQVQSKRIYADLMRVDDSGNLVLSTQGTQDDLKKYGIKLVNGMILEFYTDDLDDSGRPDPLVFQGIVMFDEVKKRWVAKIERNQIKHQSDS